MVPSETLCTGLLMLFHSTEETGTCNHDTTLILVQNALCTCIRNTLDKHILNYPFLLMCTKGPLKFGFAIVCQKFYSNTPVPISNISTEFRI